MIVYINEKNEIKDVGTTTDDTLRPVEVPSDVFNGWSEAKILCYKLDIKDGAYNGYIPGVDTRIIEHIDRLGNKNTETEARVSAVEEAVDILVLESLGL